MPRALVLASVLVFATASGCTCSRSSSRDGAGGAEDAETHVANGAGAAATPGSASPRLSAPIAATRAEGGAVLVAGVVAADKSLVVTRVGPAGATGFSVTALRGVAWSPDAELRLYPAAGGAALVWRGVRDGKPVRQMVLVGKAGEVAGEPVDVGTVACATEEAIVWTERAGAGKTRVIARTWSGAARDVTAIASEREPVVVCGTRRVYALGAGEDDVTFASADVAAASGGAPAAGGRMLVSTADFGGDDERELAEYTVGDELGAVRIGSTGHMALRETRADGLGPWTRLSAKVPSDDDLVAVDGDAKATFVITTNEAPHACSDGSSSVPSRILALRVERGSRDETPMEIAPAVCGTEVGPFWTGSVAAGFVVAWVERSGTRDALTAPIAGLAYRVVETARAPGRVVRVVRPADALVDAGCDKERCYAVALAREPGTTNLVPERAEIIAYP